MNPRPDVTEEGDPAAPPPESVRAAEAARVALAAAGVKDDAASAPAQVIEHVRERYDIHLTPAGEVFAVPRHGARLPVMLGERGGQLRDRVTAAIYEKTRRVPRAQAVDDAFRVLIGKARGGVDTTTLHLRVAEHDGAVVLDLGWPGSGRCAVATSDGWTVVDNPPPGVLFRRTSATRPLPDPSRVVGSFEPLRALLGFEADDARWTLIRGWLVAAAFPNVPRPMLLFLGAPGSAKTTRAKLVVSILDPREELGSNFGKRIEDDQVKALSRYLVSYDNLASVSEAVSDHLCRLVTGDEIDRRRLYSDADLSTLTYRRTGVLTAVALPGLRPDALDRVIVIPLDRIPENDRRSEAELHAAFTEAHAEALGAIIDELVDVLAALPTVRAAKIARPRMADYFDILTACDPECAAAYRAAAEESMADAAEADPLVATVRAWLDTVGGTWTSTATEAYEAAHAYRQRNGGAWSSDQWWPSSGRQWSAALARASEPLRAVGVEVKTGARSNGRRLTMLTTTATAQGQGLFS